MLASMEGKLVKLWDIRTGQLIHTFEGQQGITGLLFSPDGSMLVSYSDFSADLWDVKKGQLLCSFESPLAGISSIALSADEHMLAIGGLWDGYVSIRDVNTGEAITRGLEGPERQIISVAFSPSGNIFAAGSNFGKVRLWNIKTGQLLHELDTASEDDVTGLMFSPDESELATATGGYLGAILPVEVWDVKTGRLLYTLEDPNFNPSFSPDGLVLATSGIEGTLLVYDVASGQPLKSLPDVGAITKLIFSTDGLILASVHNDGEVWFWGVPTRKK